MNLEEVKWRPDRMTEDRMLLYESNVQSLPSRKVSTSVGNMIKGYKNQENYG